MSAYSLPYVIQSAELASRRAGTEVRGHLNRRVPSLASVAACASFVGFFGMVLGIFGAFHSFGSSKSTILGDEARHISEAMVPGLLGLLVALTAFWRHRYLTGQVAAFALEMECATLDLVNRLVVHLATLRTTNPAQWAALTTKPTFAGTTPPPSIDLPVEAPELRMKPMFRNGSLN